MSGDLIRNSFNDYRICYQNNDVREPKDLLLEEFLSENIFSENAYNILVEVRDEFSISFDRLWQLLNTSDSQWGGDSDLDDRIVYEEGKWEEALLEALRTRFNSNSLEPIADQTSKYFVNHVFISTDRWGNSVVPYTKSVTQYMVGDPFFLIPEGENKAALVTMRELGYYELDSRSY